MIINSVIYGVCEEPMTEGHRVRFVDYNGVLLKTQYVLTGQNATPPQLPTHPNLTFQEWNNDFTNIQTDIDIGANYRTTDDRTYFVIDVNPVSLNSRSLSIWIDRTDNAPLTVHWGDGTSQTTTASVIDMFKSQPYASFGIYTISVECNSPYNFNSLLWGTGNIRILLQAYLSGFVRSVQGFLTNQPIEKISINKDCIIRRDSFQWCRRLKAVIMPKCNTVLSDNTVFNNGSLEVYCLPSTLTSAESSSTTIAHCSMIDFLYLPNINTIIANSNMSLEKMIYGGLLYPNEFFRHIFSYKERIVINNGATSIGWNAFHNCLMTSIDHPSTITSIGAGAYHSADACLVWIFRSIIPPSLGSVAFDGIIYSTQKIYVPDASVNLYKVATNWNIVANWIYPLSEIEP